MPEAPVKTRAAADYSNSAVNLCNPEKVKEKLESLASLMQTSKSLEKQLTEENPMYQKLVGIGMAIAQLNAEIRPLIDELGSYQDKDAGMYAVKCTRKSRVYDPDMFKRTYSMYVPAVIVETINKTALEGLIKGGLLTHEELVEQKVETETIDHAYVIKVKE